MEEIKNCPFCNGKAQANGASSVGWSIYCTKCFCLVGSNPAEFKRKETYQEVVNIWNHRAELTAERKRIVGLIEELRERYADSIIWTGELDNLIKEMEGEK